MVRVIREKVVENVYLIRLDDDETKYFEGLWFIPEGITYNSYVVFTGNEVVVVDTWKTSYADLFLETLKELVDPRSVTKIIISHMEPDHSGALPKLLEANNYKALVLGHPLSKNLMKFFYGVEPRFKPVADGEEFLLGNTRVKFIYTPWLHWPETIMTYVDGVKILFSGDAFGGFSIPKTVFDEDDVVEDYMVFARKYFASIIGYYREHVVKNIEKLEGLNIKPSIIAPLHGLVWKNKPETILNYYMKWGRALSSPRKVVIVYSSMYGFVDRAVKEVIAELEKKGVKPVVYTFNDREHSNIAEILGDVIDAEAIVIGTSTYEASVFPLMDFLVGLLTRKIHAFKKVIVLAAYGWGGIAGKQVSQKLSSGGFNVVDVIEFRSSLGEEDKKKIREAVKKLWK